jgi:iron-sulfur cluster repair protein YtfE (RIC family)
MRAAPRARVRRRITAISAVQEHAMNVRVRITDTDLAQLDAYHAQVHDHLDRLATLASRVENEQLGDDTRAEACAIEAFFSGAMQPHHRTEEAAVFPALLDSGDADLVTSVHTLQQDHGWIEQNWIEVAPQLRAIALGNHWIDPAEFMHGAEVFLELCYGHAALEETVIAPQIRARVDAASAAQVVGSTR